MSTTEAATREATEALAKRLFAATIETLEVASVHVGSRLGFYRALAGDGGTAMTPGDLAKRTGHRRAVRPRVARAAGRRRLPRRRLPRSRRG